MKILNKKYAIKELIYSVVVRLPNYIIGKYIKRNLILVHWGRGLNNFGDCLSPEILRHYGLTPVYVSSLNKSKIILAGSILQWVDISYNGVIIGTGGDKMKYDFPNATIYAVRGELTLLNFPEEKRSKIALGDPGLLMPLVYPEPIKKKYRLGIIPHFVDNEEEFILLWKDKFGNEAEIINVLDSPKSVIRKIKQCEHIVSSSLHGLIIADAYHIPTLRFVNRRTMPGHFYDYKFEDYASSLNCMYNVIEPTGKESLEELISLTTLKPVQVIQNLQKNLDNIIMQVSKKLRK